MKDCVFCKIVKGEISSKFLYENGDLVVFPDIHPSAPIHYLIVPKKHHKDIAQAPDKIWVEIKKLALKIARSEGHKGFRLGNNYGDAALIEHMHVHYLSGIKKDRAI